MEEDKEEKAKEEEIKKRYSLIEIALTVLIPMVLIVIISGIVWRIGGPIVLAVIVAIMTWLLFSIKIIGPAEMAVKVILGVPVSVCNSGFRFVPYFFKCYLARYPKRLYNLNYSARVIISKEGEYGKSSTEKRKGNKKENGKRYGTQVLKVDSVAYLRFPSDENLIKILRSQIPIDKEKLTDWTEESVIGALRVALGKTTWKEATENVAGVREEAEKVFKAEDGTLRKAGFHKKNLRLVIEEIHLPKELEEALPQVDRQRLEAEAAPNEAKQRAIETVGTLIQMISEETGINSEEIQKKIKEEPGEFFEKYKDFFKDNLDLIHRRMAMDRGLYVDIRTQNPLLDLITAWKKMPGETLLSKTEKPKKKKIEEMSDKEAIKEALK